MMNHIEKSNHIELYKLSDKQIEIQVKFDDDTVWLTQQQMALLFNQTKQNISLHINNCFKEGELDKKSTVKEFLTVQWEGKRRVKRSLEYYCLDVITSFGYRVKSFRGTQFRMWATKILKNKLLESVKRQNPEQELIRVVKYIGRITGGKELDKEEAAGLLNVITGYTHALDLLDRYDHQRLELTSILKNQSGFQPIRSEK